MALWFSASAVLPSLQVEYDIGPALASLYTSSVQTGFVAGTLISAVLGLADRLDMRRFFMVSTLLAAGVNAVILLVEPTSPVVFVCRFLTGAAMAGIYPVGMKIAVGWGTAVKSTCTILECIVTSIWAPSRSSSASTRSVRTSFLDEYGTNT